MRKWKKKKKKSKQKIRGEPPESRERKPEFHQVPASLAGRKGERRLLSVLKLALLSPEGQKRARRIEINGEARLISSASSSRVGRKEGF